MLTLVILFNENIAYTVEEEVVQSAAKVLVPNAIIIVCPKKIGSSQLALSIATKWPPRHGETSSTDDWL